MKIFERQQQVWITITTKLEYKIQRIFAIICLKINDVVRSICSGTHRDPYKSEPHIIIDNVTLFARTPLQSSFNRLQFISNYPTFP